MYGGINKTIMMHDNLWLCLFWHHQTTDLWLCLFWHHQTTDDVYWYQQRSSQRFHHGLMGVVSDESCLKFHQPNLTKLGNWTQKLNKSTKLGSNYTGIFGIAWYSGIMSAPDWCTNFNKIFGKLFWGPHESIMQDLIQG